MNQNCFHKPVPQSFRRIARACGTAATTMSSCPRVQFAPATHLRPQATVLLTSWLSLVSGCSTTDDGNPTTTGDTSNTSTAAESGTNTAGTTSLSAATSTTTATTTASSAATQTTTAPTSASGTTANTTSTANSVAPESGSGTSAPESSAGSTTSTEADSSSSSATSAQSTSEQSTSSSGDVSDAVDPITFAQGFSELFIHDECTAPNPDSPDTCLHEQLHEENFTFGGDSGTTYDVQLRVRGLFEPTNINGGETPYPEFPYFKVGGTVNAADYSQWHIEVSEPEATYWLNHYPSTGHTIYQEDFIVVISVAAGAEVSVRVVDGNNRMIDNGATGLADRQQTIEGVTEGVLDGQVLRLDVEDVAAQ